MSQSYRIVADLLIEDLAALRAEANRLLEREAVEPDPALNVHTAVLELISEILHAHGVGVIDFAAVPESRADAVTSPTEIRTRGLDAGER